MEWQTIKPERAKELSEMSNGSILFDIMDNKIIGVKFEGPDGPIAIKIDSYSVNVCETQKKTMWCLSAGWDVSYHDSMEQAFNAAKDFGSDVKVSIKQVNMEG